jgi:predicted NBD/HSP70 family sugar kinase
VTSVLACVEVGGSGQQTVLFSDDHTMVVMDGAHQPPAARLALAVPGLIDGTRVVTASNLGWLDVDPVAALGLRGPAEVVCNDAEAAAIGEAALLNGDESGDESGDDASDEQAGSLVFVGLGTGVGGAVVHRGAIVASNLFGHGGGFGDAECPCGRRGCLETVAAGWALPDDLDRPTLVGVAAAVARAIETEPIAAGTALVVVAGGIARRHPEVVGMIADALPGRTVRGSAAPAGVKSAAPWGLRYLVGRREAAVTEGGRS